MDHMEPNLEVWEEGAVIANIGCRLRGARRALDLLQSCDPCIEFALIGGCPLKCVVPEAFERVLRARNLTGEAGQVIDGVRRLGCVAVKRDRDGGSGGARGGERQAQRKTETGWRSGHEAHVRATTS